MEHISCKVEGAVGLVEIIRPPVNALNAEVARDLWEALSRLAEPDVRAAVITGRPHFAAGADISRFKKAHDSGARSRSEEAARLAGVVRRMELLPCPIIAAVFGYALGGGLELAMGADFRYLAEDASVGQPEIRLGLIPGAGGTQRLTRLVGFSRGKELIYTGRHIGASEALEIGLADKVLPADELLEVALEDAARFANGPSVALAMAKRAINEGWGRPIEDGTDIEASAFDRAFGSEDAREGVAAFIEKRPPTFRGE